MKNDKARAEKIQNIIDNLQSKGQRLTVNKIVVSSIFYSGGTLAGYEDEIKKAIKAQPPAPPLSRVPIFDINTPAGRKAHTKALELIRPWKSCGPL